jgi:hypothetical protein
MFFSVGMSSTLQPFHSSCASTLMRWAIVAVDSKVPTMKAEAENGIMFCDSDAGGGQ